MKTNRAHSTEMPSHCTLYHTYRHTFHFLHLWRENVSIFSHQKVLGCRKHPLPTKLHTRQPEAQLFNTHPSFMCKLFAIFFFWLSFPSSFRPVLSSVSTVCSFSVLGRGLVHSTMKVRLCWTTGYDGGETGCMASGGGSDYLPTFLHFSGGFNNNLCGG